MAQTLRELRSTLQSAVDTFNEVSTRNEYIRALWSCQALELNVKVLLYLSIKRIQRTIGDDFLKYQPKIKYSKSNLDDLIKKLVNFYPEPENSGLINSLKLARDKRNNFIHGVFKITTRGLKTFNFSLKPELHPESIKIMKGWTDQYSKTLKLLLNYITKFDSSYKIKINDLI